MAILNSSQIAKLAYQAGFRGDALNIAVAIAMAESGGNTAAYNPETAAGTPPGSGSRGLWQIYGVAHPEFNNESAFDPTINARAAYKVFIEAGNRFTPWSTYNAGLAIPRQNYASQIGGTLTERLRQPQPTQQASQQPRPNQLSNSLQGSLQGAQAGGGQGENKPANPLAGVPEAIQGLPASIIDSIMQGRTGTDLTFYILGFVFILMAIFLVLLGAAGAFAGSDVGKTAIKAALI
jgi:hypothetical protein